MDPHLIAHRPWQCDNACGPSEEDHVIARSSAHDPLLTTPESMWECPSISPLKRGFSILA